VATFDTTSVSFRTGDFVNTLTIPDKTLTLVPSTSNLGRTSAQANIESIYSPLSTTVTTPEPTSIAIFVASIAGLGLRRRLRASR